MTKFEVFLGTWNTTGNVLETEAGPAGTLAATDTYRWLPGNHFMVHDVDARFDGKPTRSMELMGFDSAKRRFFATSYDDQGTFETFAIALEGRRFRIHGEDGPLRRVLRCVEESPHRSLGAQRVQGEMAAVDRARIGACVRAR